MFPILFVFAIRWSPGLPLEPGFLFMRPAAFSAAACGPLADGASCDFQITVGGR